MFFEAKSGEVVYFFYYAGSIVSASYYNVLIYNTVHILIFIIFKIFFKYLIFQTPCEIGRGNMALLTL